MTGNSGCRDRHSHGNFACKVLLDMPDLHLERSHAENPDTRYNAVQKIG